MQRSFGGTALEPVDQERDKELTLGPIALTGLGVALCAFCAVFFLWGYSIGHHGSAQPLSQDARATGASAEQLIGAQTKPGIAKPNANQPATGSGGSAPVAGGDDSPQAASYTDSSSTTESESNAAVVQTSLSAERAAGSNTPWMVQIAAVSREEDADVLTSALRKRGYLVSVRHDPVDDLRHVQVGPFATHADAASMRQRLLNDGYNALIEP